MKHVLPFFLASFFVLTGASRAQESASNHPRMTDEKWRRIELSLLYALGHTSPGVRSSAAQTIRDLRAIYPDRSFSPFVIPLMRNLRDEDEEDASRILSALALDELHSSVGDFAIKGVAQETDHRQLKHVCAALAQRRVEENQADPPR